jgi:acyl-CoA reductase-like NAD-dependent aldehyde dehydrogenase
MTLEAAMGAIVEARQSFIDGKYVTGDGPALAVENPATEAIIAEVESASLEQIEQAIGAARRTFDDGVWANVPASQRSAVVRRMAEYLTERRDLLVSTVIAEAGAPHENATTIQVGAALDHAQLIPDLYLQLAQQEYNPLPPTGHTPSGRVAVSMNVYEPVGVVSAISAYNFPFYLNVWKTLPALMAGCSVVLRPSPLTPLSAMLFGEAADAAGLPAGVLNIVIDQQIGGGRLITTHPAVDMVTFTGSTQVGREIMAQAASTVKKVHLELGGKSAAIYLPEAAENAWHMCLGVFMAHQGQGCALATRILVPHERKAEIMERAAEFARQLPIGDPSDPSIVMGPLITEAQVAKSEHYVAAAVKEGATLVSGGQRPAHLDKGHFFEPTLLDVPDNSNPAAQDEIFGPVASVIGYDDVDDAVRIANDSIFGLAGMVFGETNRATEVAQRIRSGTVWVNTAAPSGSAPFGGYKQSGVGREMGYHGFREYQEIKHLYIG